MELFKSRTVWAVIIGLVLTTLQTVHDFLPLDVYILAESILTALAVYFRANPKQEF
jgi:hypothetical protein